MSENVPNVEDIKISSLLNDKTKDRLWCTFTAALESFDSVLGIFMASAVACDAAEFGGGSMILSGAVSLFFGIFIFYFTWTLLRQKQKEEKAKQAQLSQTKLILGFLGISGLIVTTVGAGLDAAAPCFQEGIDHSSASTLSKIMAGFIFFLAFLSFACRAVKYYSADLATQIEKPDDLPGIESSFKKNNKVGGFLRGLIFQVFPVGEGVAHLLAAYIVYSDFIQPYLMHNDNISDLFSKISLGYSLTAIVLLAIGVFIGVIACAAQYIIIKASDLDWAYETLKTNDNSDSMAFDNNFRGIGRLLLFILSWGCSVGATENLTVHKRLLRRLQAAKVFGQGIFTAAGFLLIASLIATGFKTTDIAGSLNHLHWQKTSIVILASAIFLVGFALGGVLGWRYLKLKNANHELDLFLAAYVNANYSLQSDALNNNHMNSWRDAREANKKAKNIWAERKQTEDSDVNNKSNSCCSIVRDYIIPILISIVGTVGGISYGIYTKSSVFRTIEFGVSGLLIGILAFCISASPKQLLQKYSDNNINDSNNDGTSNLNYLVLE